MATATTNGVAPRYSAVPDLSDAERLLVVQQQIQGTRVRVYQIEAALLALDPDDGQVPGFRDELGRHGGILARYRAIEAELLERLNSGTATP